VISHEIKRAHGKYFDWIPGDAEIALNELSRRLDNEHGVA
jgi:hypothetical protein